MKFQLFLVTCLLATAYAGLLAPNSLAVDSSTSNDSANTTASDSECGNGTDNGLGGLLEQVGNLLGNILANILKIRLAGLKDPGLYEQLSGLLKQLQQLLLSLIAGLNLTDAQVGEKETELSGILRSIESVLNDLLGDGKGDTWACQSAGGLVGSILGRLVSAIQGLLTGSWSNDRKVVLNLLNQLLNLVTTILTQLL